MGKIGIIEHGKIIEGYFQSKSCSEISSETSIDPNIVFSVISRVIGDFRKLEN